MCYSLQDHFSHYYDDYVLHAIITNRLIDKTLGKGIITRDDDIIIISTQVALLSPRKRDL